MQREITTSWQISMQELKRAEWWFEAANYETRRLSHARAVVRRAGDYWRALAPCEQRAVAMDLINAGIIESDAAQEAEARANMLVFVRRLPLIEDCDFGTEYVQGAWGTEYEGRSSCSFRTTVAGYEAWGSSEAAAYGRLIGKIVEREG